MLLDIKFETRALNDAKWRWKLQGHHYPIYVLLVFLSPKFNPFHSMASRFWVTGRFETSAPNDSKWLWTLSGQTNLIYVVLELPNFIPFRSTISYFQNICNFPFPHWPHYVKFSNFSNFIFQKFKEVTFVWTVTGNCYKKLVGKKQKCRRSSFVKSVFLEKLQVHGMTAKWLWTLWGQGVSHICFTTTPES